MNVSHDPPALLAGPPPEAGPEPLESHRQRLGPRPAGGPDLVDTLRASRLRGRGGAGFPAWRKLDAVAQRSHGHAVVVANGAEGEPASRKDRVLMTLRPHLVLDGALLAAEAVRASTVIVYVDRGYADARAALLAACRELGVGRSGWGAARAPRVEVVEAPPGFIAGEETAAVRRINGGPAKPTFGLPRVFERGVRGRPTLVHNVETLAHIALIARFGGGWFRSLGGPAGAGTMLVTISGNVPAPGVYEIPRGATLDQALAVAGGPGTSPAILVGGYFGSWVTMGQAAMRLDDAPSQEGLRSGCGVLFALPEEACGLRETAKVLDYLAGASAGQCGPCRQGLPALAGAFHRLVEGAGEDREHLDRVRRWSSQLDHGRGACRHPDGAVSLLRSALEVFADDLHQHRRGRPCRGGALGPMLLAEE